MRLDPNTSRAGYQAQHIIPKEFKNHPILKKIGIDLDDASVRTEDFLRRMLERYGY